MTSKNIKQNVRDHEEEKVGVYKSDSLKHRRQGS